LVDELRQWLDRGCPDEEAASLYMRIGDNDDFKKRVQRCPSSCRRRLRFLLIQMSGSDASVYSGTSRKEEGERFRGMYPFLSDLSIPDELKILATDKMTTYWRCVELHERLYLCNSNDECVQCAGELVCAFKEDQSIKDELDFYKLNGKPLGKHRLFHRNREMESIRNLGLRQLIQKERQLRGNIWRIEDEMKKGEKPWLDEERRERLSLRKRELEYVEQLLSNEEGTRRG